MKDVEDTTLGYKLTYLALTNTADSKQLLLLAQDATQLENKLAEAEEAVRKLKLEIEAKP